MKQMKYSRRLLAAAVIIAGLGVGVIGVGTTFAAQANHNSGMSGLVEAIAAKFNLKVADVQAVFDEQRQQMESSIANREAETLTQAVADGKITQAQVDVITAKRQELKDSMESFASMNEDDRRAAMKTQMNDLKQWAEKNDIPLNEFHPFLNGGMRGGFGMKDGPMHRGFGGHSRMEGSNQVGQ
ncbi:MAG TPA: hypothetical protein VJB99_02610 [Patescibacteria group bacterium]|nr:hypothetical protein [Patescibacteria group bacterium]